MASPPTYWASPSLLGTEMRSFSYNHNQVDAGRVSTTEAGRPCTVFINTYLCAQALQWSSFCASGASHRLCVPACSVKCLSWTAVGLVGNGNHCTWQQPYGYLPHSSWQGG